MRPSTTLDLLNSLSVTQISELSKFSKSYISQVKNGKCPPSRKLLEFLQQYHQKMPRNADYYSLFMQSRESLGASDGTMQFYRTKIGRFLSDVKPDQATRQDIEIFLLQFSNLGNRHAYFRAIKTFFNWRTETYDLPSPMKYVKAPKQLKLILPSLTDKQVNTLIKTAVKVRDKAIIAMLTESGLRISELIAVQPEDIYWKEQSIKVLGKGRKEAFAPLGKQTQKYLKQWLEAGQTSGNIWDLNKWGVTSMLRRLEAETGITCNPHTFRRTFACLLRKAGLDVLTIKDLGRWESVEMVQRYTRSVTFQDSMKFYHQVLGEGEE